MTVSLVLVAGQDREQIVETALGDLLTGDVATGQKAATPGPSEETTVPSNDLLGEV